MENSQNELYKCVIKCILLGKEIILLIITQFPLIQHGISITQTESYDTIFCYNNALHSSIAQITEFRLKPNGLILRARG